MRQNIAMACCGFWGKNLISNSAERIEDRCRLCGSEKSRKGKNVVRLKGQGLMKVKAYQKG